MNRVVMKTIGIVLLSQLFFSHVAAQNYAEKPITLIVPGSPGGSTDVLGRVIGEHLSRELGQPILVDNVTGAGGTIAINKVAKSSPNGQTLVMGSTGLIAAAPSLYAKLSYDPVKELDAVVRLPDMAIALYTNPNGKFKNLNDLLAYAEKNPGKLNFADGGVGTSSNLLTRILAKKAGVEVTQVSYKGNTPGMLALAAGQVDAIFETVSAGLPLVKGGKVNAIAVASLQPQPLLPGVPRIADTFPGFEENIWLGLYAPKGTPQSVIHRIEAAYLKSLKNPALQQRFTELGMQIPSETEVTSAGLQSFTEAQIRKYQAIIRDANIAPQ